MSRHNISGLRKSETSDGLNQNETAVFDKDS